MSCHRPFCRNASLTAFAVAMVVLLTPVSSLPARAQTGQQATLSDHAKSDTSKSETSKTDTSKAAAPQATGGNVAAADHANPAQKSLTTKAIERVKEAAKSAGDIFSRVPCLPPKGGARTMGSLPHVANKLASGEPVLIIAFGSSSTSGYGSTSPEYTYPNRLAAQ